MIPVPDILRRRSLLWFLQSSSRKPIIRALSCDHRTAGESDALYSDAECGGRKRYLAASGVNEAHVAMTATETITSNPRVLGADPLVVYQPAADGKEEIAGGIGEEDLVCLVLPYIRSAREGVFTSWQPVGAIRDI